MFIRKLFFLFFSLFFLFSLEADQVKIESLPTCINGYFLSLEGKPFFVRGVIYNPTPVGEGYDYDFTSDPNKPWLIDGPIMKRMGINCIRIYSVGKDLEKTKDFIRTMYENFGIHTIVSDWLGLWEKGGPRYADKDFSQKEKERVLKIIEALKDEKGVLMWVLGNENDYTFSGRLAFWSSPEIEALGPALRSRKRAEIYYNFIEDLAKEIKRIDPARPVALGSGEINFLPIAGKICKSIDVLAIIFYRGKDFCDIFSSIRKFFDKPILISEFGCDSYDAYRLKEAQEAQAEYLLSQWKDIYRNSVFSGNRQGNCIGGTMFEWNDEWWKHNEGYAQDWQTQNTEAGWAQGAYTFDNRAKDGKNMNEEWFGIVALAAEKERGVNKRLPKKSYYILKGFFEEIIKTSHWKKE